MLKHGRKRRDLNGALLHPPTDHRHLIVCNVVLRRLKQDCLRGLQALRQLLRLGGEGSDLHSAANGLFRDADLTGGLFDAALLTVPLAIGALAFNRANLARLICLSLCCRFLGVLLCGGDLDPPGHQFGALDLPQFPAVQVLGDLCHGGAYAGNGKGRP
ncbi:hypothetical protein AP071_00180 [Rhodobacter capsulatus]|nr:hypothetical protein AP073_00175 [Rhodobacter capsulatus]KQB17496.1 hypothetical protein AP071_00180 [Rhodobacter capsulatus]